MEQRLINIYLNISTDEHFRPPCSQHTTDKLVLASCLNSCFVRPDTFLSGREESNKYQAQGTVLGEVSIYAFNLRFTYKTFNLKACSTCSCKCLKKICIFRAFAWFWTRFLCSGFLFIPPVTELITNFILV